ncbi:uncharacterized protein B0H18DRAFT_957038 [Fomitopsis serialis]|uniref:uncharacterized protein n=1 Tax=Fomitopsis serialis TaxID=139415 RepID=UPI0020086BAF|nr:uncharacterized protein B0H18DRAFT_957038 [Neoantrodia serialis]KAH9920441.1 hypothetical protein B0H18DRAFT_957038 [Neoantrodia serialis]
MFASVKTLLVCGALALAAAAQNINIALPTALTSVNPGDNVTVQVEKPNSLTGSTEVGIAIGLKSCTGYTGGCDHSPHLVLGADLLLDEWYPYQNFTVTIPESFQSGQAILSATHLVLVGAGPYADTETVNQTITVA